MMLSGPPLVQFASSPRQAPSGHVNTETEVPFTFGEEKHYVIAFGERFQTLIKDTLVAK